MAGRAGTPGEAPESQGGLSGVFFCSGRLERGARASGGTGVGTRQGWTDLSGLAPSRNIWGLASVALQLVSSPAVSLAYTCIPSLGDWPCWLSLMSSQEEWARADGIAVDGASLTEALASPGVSPFLRFCPWEDTGLSHDGPRLPLEPPL